MGKWQPLQRAVLDRRAGWLRNYEVEGWQLLLRLVGAWGPAWIRDYGYAGWRDESRYVQGRCLLKSNH